MGRSVTDGKQDASGKKRAEWGRKKKKTAVRDCTEDEALHPELNKAIKKSSEIIR